MGRRPINPARKAKKCSLCKRVKMMEHFSRSQSQPDGHHHTCSVCDMTSAAYSQLRRRLGTDVNAMFNELARYERLAQRVERLLRGLTVREATREELGIPTPENERGHS